MMMKTISKKGFTLVELLIALALFAVLAIALFRAFFVGLKVWQTEQQTHLIYQQARTSLEYIAKNLRNTVPLFPQSFTGEQNTLSWTTLNPTLSDDNKWIPTWKRLSVRLQSTPERGQNQLMLQSERLGKEGNSELELVPLTTLDTEFTLSFSDPKSPEGNVVWLDQWKEKGVLPRLVKIHLILKDPEKSQAYSFVKLIQLPLGEFHHEPA